MYKDSLSKIKNISNENNSVSNIFQGNSPQLNSVNNNSSMNINRNNNNLNNSYYTYNPQRNFEHQNNERDESFRYSYYLIDNLKNAINSVDFKKDYSNYP